MLGTRSYWEGWMGKHGGEGDGQTPDFDEMFSKQNQNVQWLWVPNRSAAIQKLPYSLGQIPKCEIIAAQFITSCHELKATSGNSHMFYDATWHYGTQALPVFVFFILLGEGN